MNAGLKNVSSAPPGEREKGGARANHADRDREGEFSRMTLRVGLFGL